VLPDNFPRAALDSAGVCSYCRSAEGKPREPREAVKRRFEALLRERPGKGAYDALVAYSGGKDSSYALTLAVKEYKLRVLAFTFDNGFIAPGAVDNARRVTDRLGADHMVFKVPAPLLNKIFRRSLESSPYPAKSAERAGAVCTSCIGFVKYLSFKTAMEKKIPFVVFGWTPGQAPVESAIIELTPEMGRGMADAARVPMEKLAGESLAAYFPGPEDGAFPCLAHPAAFSGYDEKSVYKTIAALGWKKPRGLDANSTNCMLNSLSVQAHIRTHGFNPYTYEIARLVREGYLARAEGMKRLRAPVPAATVRAVRRRLGA
jgi:tRNA(Ile)-lysidine synthase TilS/MesJ